MVQKCIYCGKNQKENNIEKKQSFHKFPDAVEHSNIFQKWVSNMNLKSIKISKHSRLCSDHFEEKNFAIKDKNIYLKPGSVPTLFSKTKVQCIFCKTEKGTNQARSFHKFPMNNPNILNMWISNMHMENLYPTSDDVLCSDHFKQDCFLRHGQRKTLQLKRNAILTIFIAEISTSQTNNENTLINENSQLHNLNENTVDSNEMIVDNGSICIKLVSCLKCNIFPIFLHASYRKTKKKKQKFDF